MYPAAPVNDRHLLIFVSLFHPFVQLSDDRNKMRNHLFQVREGPLFQRLCQYRMVCVRARLRDDLHCLIKGYSPLCHKSYKFRDDHGRMRVIDLDHHMVVKPVKVISLFIHFL